MHFCYEFSRNVVMFDVENISSKYYANRKNNFLMLGQGTTDDINDSVGEAIVQ